MKPTVKSLQGISTGLVDIQLFQALLDGMWPQLEAKYEEVNKDGKNMSQWIKAYVMGMADDAEITFE